MRVSGGVLGLYFVWFSHSLSIKHEKLSLELELNPVEFQLKGKSRIIQKLFDPWIDL